MKGGKWIVFIGLAVLIAVAAICWHMNPVPEAEISTQTDNVPVSVGLITDAGVEKITLWECSSLEYAVFLPGYGAASELQFSVASGFDVWLDGYPLSDGDIIRDFKTEVRYELTCEGKHTERITAGLTIYRGSHIPAVYVDVRSGSMTYIHGAKGAEESGEMRIYLPDGQLHFSGNLESVKGRGNATWEWEKKPYNLKLRSAADILGMGSAQKWVLLANVYDDAHIRNKAVYDTAIRMGMDYSPQSQWVDLYLNGEYAGLYLLCEKNEIHPQRVAIDSVKGNLISIEKADRLWEYGQNQFVTDGGIPIRIHATTDPKKLQETINRAERAILAEDGTDPVSGLHWSDLIDLESWVYKYLIEEVFGNLDAGSISQFFYWEDDGKIYAGPVWDYDVTMGNAAAWQLCSPNMLYAGRPHLWNPEDTPWFYGLYQKDAFQEKAAVVYKEQLRPQLDMLISTGFTQYAQTIRESAVSNQIRWKTLQAAEETERIRTYMAERMAFLDKLWLEETEIRLVQLYMKWHVMACYGIEPGELVPEQEVPADYENIVYKGWYVHGSEQQYDFSQPVTQDMLLYLKEEDTSFASDITSGGLSGKIWLMPAVGLVILMVLVCSAEIYRIPTYYKNKKKQPAAAERGGTAK